MAVPSGGPQAVKVCVKTVVEAHKPSEIPAEIVKKYVSQADHEACDLGVLMEDIE